MNDHNPQNMLTSTELDTLMGILSAQERRAVLYRLGREDSLNESDLLVGGVNQSDQQKIALHHTHLPKLDEAQYIEWERETGVVRPGDRYDDVEFLLDLLQTQTDEFPSDMP